MGLELKIGKFGVSIGRARAEKMGRGQMISVEDWEQQQGIDQPFDYSEPSKAYRNISWVYACVRAISTAVQGVPLQTHRQRGQTAAIVETGPLPDLFWNVNPHMSRADLWEWTMGSLELSGNSYWEIERNARGIPLALYPLRPDRVTIVPDKQEFIKGYIYSVNGRELAFAPEDVFHLRYWNPESDYYGMGPYQASSRIATIDSWAQKYNERFFTSDATPGGVLETDEPLDDEQAKALRKRWESIHQDRRRAFRIAILSEGLKWKATQTSLKDMLFPDLRKMNREEICAMFGAPPGVVGILDYANYANLREQQRIFWKNKIVPTLKKIEEALNQGFVPYFKDATLYVAFDLSNVEALREDQNEKTKREEILVRTGLRTINELRADDGLEPVSWGDEPPGQTGIAIPSNGDGAKMADASLIGAFTLKARTLHFDVDRQYRHLLPAAKELTRALAERMLEHLGSDERMKRLRGYAGSTDDPDAKRDPKRDRDIVDGIFGPMDDEIEGIARAHEAELEGPYKTLYEKGARFGAKKLRAAKALMRARGAAPLPYRGGKGFELLDPNILKYLADRRAFWLNRSMQDEYDELKALLVSEYFEKWRQESDADLLLGIEKAFRTDATWRAERIARTETHHIGQNAQREMFKRSLVRILEWAHSGNPNGRENHIALDGATIDIEAGEKFYVGGYSCDGPGDSSLGPEESINCGCDTMPAIQQQGEEYSLPDELWDGA